MVIFQMMKVVGDILHHKSDYCLIKWCFPIELLQKCASVSVRMKKFTCKSVKFPNNI
jgi:hypothetical protein